MREVEKVDLLIALSRGGVRTNADGTITEGTDINLAREVPGIYVVVGGHDHTGFDAPVIVKGRTPVVQAGHNGGYVDELTVTIESDAFRRATGALIALTANGLMLNGLTRGRSGVQTVYDVFAVAPAGSGVLEMSPGSTLVTGCLTGREIRNVLEF